MERFVWPDGDKRAENSGAHKFIRQIVMQNNRFQEIQFYATNWTIKLPGYLLCLWLNERLPYI